MFHFDDVGREEQIFLGGHRFEPGLYLVSLDLVKNISLERREKILAAFSFARQNFDFI
jgi:hypothetical protein